VVYIFLYLTNLLDIFGSGAEQHCTDCLRVTVGTPDENDRFIQLLHEVARELGIQ
jgi:histidinol-phosphate/aromatic aminotransferase/cobyric acid decarboxylase-like protein